MQNNPLNKVVFIQKVAAFTKTKSPIKDLLQLAYVNNSWNDTIMNYSFHLFESRVRDVDNENINTIEDVDTGGEDADDPLEKVCASVIKCRVIWFVDVLMSSKIVLNRINFPCLACRNQSSVDMMQFVFEKIVEAGGMGLLKSQLSATNNQYGWTCLMHGCSQSSSLEVMKMIFEKIVEVGGNDLLKNQLSATTDKGHTCLRLGCSYSSPEVMQLIFEKIVEVGGTEMLKSQLTAATVDSDGWNCLMLVCWHCSSSEVVKLIFEKIIEVGGVDMLKSMLAATNKYGSTCLTIGCYNSSSQKVMALLTLVLFELGLFQEQYAMLIDEDKDTLREKTEIENASWAPDPDTIAEVKKMLKS